MSPALIAKRGGFGVCDEIRVSESDTRARRRGRAAPAALRTGEIEADLGRQADAFTLAAYDALRVGVNSIVATGQEGLEGTPEEGLHCADGYLGMSGPDRAQQRGDRAFGSYDFFSVHVLTRSQVASHLELLDPARRSGGTLVGRSNCTLWRRDPGRGEVGLRFAFMRHLAFNPLCGECVRVALPALRLR